MEFSAHEIADAQTRQIEKMYKSSRPRPRNSAMGFPKGKRGEEGRILEWMRSTNNEDDERNVG